MFRPIAAIKRKAKGKRACCGGWTGTANTASLASSSKFVGSFAIHFESTAVARCRTVELFLPKYETSPGAQQQDFTTGEVRPFEFSLVTCSDPLSIAIGCRFVTPQILQHLPVLIGPSKLLGTTTKRLIFPVITGTNGISPVEKPVFANRLES